MITGYIILESISFAKYTFSRTLYLRTLRQTFNQLTADLFSRATVRSRLTYMSICITQQLRAQPLSYQQVKDYYCCLASSLTSICLLPLTGVLALYLTLSRARSIMLSGFFPITILPYFPATT